MTSELGGEVISYYIAFAQFIQNLLNEDLNINSF